jgi:hypothetical protein
MVYLTSTEDSDDRRAYAVARGLLFVLGCQIDAETSVFRQAAAAAKATRALAGAVAEWRHSPEILSIIESNFRTHRDTVRSMFAHAATWVQTRQPYWKWTVWLSVALTNNWLRQPFLWATRAMRAKKPWWRWTVWLAAAMGARRTEFVTHDMPSRIEHAATVAAEFEAIASSIAEQLYFRSPDLLTVKRGRPTDHVRRELMKILHDGGLSQREVADLVEDDVCASGDKLERHRGRAKRTKRTKRTKQPAAQVNPAAAQRRKQSKHKPKPGRR